jgi:solute:Na+ symporter, SSS family
MNTETDIFIGVAIYMVLMLVIGAQASKKAKTSAEFIVAGRKLPIFICTATIVATWFGGGTMMGASGAAYDDGLLGVVADPFGAALALFIVGMFFARLFRRLRLLTYVDLVDQRYGKIAAFITTITNLVSNIGWIGAMLVAFGLVFESLTGTPLEIGIIAGAVVIILYTMVGGMWAVALTDAYQMGIIMFGLVILLVVVLVDVGGWSTISAQLPEGTFRLLPREHSWEHWLNYFRLWFIFGLTDVAGQNLIGRAMAAKSERVAQNAFYLGSFSYLVFGMIPVLIGIIASVTMPGLSSSESVIPAMAIEHLHPVGVAVFVGAILAAIMSSCDSALLACASITSRNLLPLFVRDPADKRTLLVARIAIPVYGCTAILVALKAQVVFDVMIDANVVSLCSVVMPFFLAVWWKKANRTGALAAMFAGFGAWLLSRTVAPELPGDLIGLGASLVTMVIVSSLTQKFDPPRPLVDIDGEPVEMTNRLGTLPLFRRT